MRFMEKIIACEISFIPIQSKDYINDVDIVLELIRNTGFEISVGAMSTTVIGECDRIFELIQTIFATMDEKCKFSMQVKYSNLCGCDV